MMKMKCNDCKYYLPVDVVQGICKMTKQKILPEDSFCEKGEKVAKCKFCSTYTAEKDHIGKCGEKLAYPDMIAVNCDDFSWISQN